MLRHCNQGRNRFTGIGLAKFDSSAKVRLIISVMIGIALAAAVAPAAIDPGPAPSWDEAVVIGNQAILSRLIDPDSARVAWPYTLFGGSLKGLFSKRQTGWITCGLVNARNRMGGYTGNAFFLIVIRDRQVISLEIGQPGEIDVASATCPDLIKKGTIRPSGALADPMPVAMSTPSAAQAGAVAAASAAQQGGLGISFIPSDAGLVIVAVAPGSPAESAGLKASQVIQKVNGIDLRGMSQEAAQAVLKGLPNSAELELAAGAKVSILRKEPVVAAPAAPTAPPPSLPAATKRKPPVVTCITCN
jgi:hypothetical protein